MTPRAREGLQGARNSQEDMEGMQGPRNKGTPGSALGSGVEQPEFPAAIPAPHSRFSSSSLGKRRSISMERRTFAVPVDNSIPRLDP